MVLITGVTGLVGSYLTLHLLENGDSVCAIYRTEASKNKTKSIFVLNNKSHLFDKIVWVNADINDLMALEIAFQNIDCVYHCAGLISFDAKDEEKLRQTNIEGTANIVNLCLAYNIKKMCHVSSIAALGDLKKNHQKTIDENTEWNPEQLHSDYAISKYGGEIEVFRAQQEGLKTIIVNPGVILGASNEKTGSNAIVQTVKNGLQFYTKGSTGFVAVTDLVHIMYLLMNKDVSGQRFVIVSENYSYKKLLTTIADMLQVKKPRYKISKTILSLAWRIDWIICLFFMQKRKLSRDMARSLITKDSYDNEKIKKLLDYQFETVQTTLSKVIASTATAAH